MNALGIVLILAGLMLFVLSPRPGRPRFTAGGLRIRGIAGPVLIIIGILIVFGVIG